MIKALKYDPYLQTTDFIHWIESMANEGMFITGLNQDSLWVNFRRDEPKNVSYTVYAIENSKLFNKDEFFDIAKEQGWNLVGYGTYMRELFLFINELENPIPLETDPIEQIEKNQNLKRLALWSFGLSVLIILIYSFPIRTTSSFGWLPIIGYGGLASTQIVQALRTGYAGDKSKEKLNRIAKIVNRLRIGLISIVLILLVCLGFRTLHMYQVFIDTNPLEEWNLSENQTIVNESYSISRFSFMPNFTSLVTIKEDGHLTRSIYQTKQNYLRFTNEDFLKIINNNLDMFIYDDALNYGAEQFVPNDRVLFRSSNNMEYWSFVKRGNTLLTLHTINLTQAEHQNLLKKLEVIA